MKMGDVTSIVDYSGAVSALVDEDEVSFTIPDTGVHTRDAFIIYDHVASFGPSYGHRGSSFSQCECLVLLL